MKLTIRKNPLLWFLVYAVVAGLVLYQSERLLQLEYSEWQTGITWLFLGMLAVQLFISKRVFGRFLNLSVILLALTYLFNLSFPFVLEFGKDFAGQVQYKIREFSQYTFQLMVTYPVKYIALLFGGMLLPEVFGKSQTRLVQDAEGRVARESDTYIRTLAWVFLLLATPIDLVLLVVRLLAMLRGGYMDAYHTASEAKYYATFASYLMLAAVFLLWRTEPRDGRKKVYFMLYCLYQVVWMFAGQRALPMICIIVAFWLYFGFEKRIRFWDLLKVAALGYAGLVVLNVIREFRSSGFEGLTMEHIFGVNVIYDTMVEFGVTVNIWGYVLNFTGDHPFGAGLVYMIAFILPKVSWLGLDPKVYDIYAVLDLSTAGSSYLAEMLFEFQSFGYAAVFLYGVFVRWLDRRVYLLVSTKQYVKLIKYIALVVMVIFCVRTGTKSLLRTFVWTAALAYIIRIFITKKKHKIQGGTL